LEFKVVVKLPHSDKHGPVGIKKFTADMSIFSMHVADFLKTFFFQHISLKTTNMPIGVDVSPLVSFALVYPLMTCVQSLGGDYVHLQTTNNAINARGMIRSPEIQLQTTNGPIMGVYNSSKSLSLLTSNSRINADIHLYNDGERVTDLVVKTTNG
jgi:hypothetical protein